MSDFFGALELELRAAAGRRPRRRVGPAHIVGALAAAALMVAAVAIVTAVVAGGGNGDSPQPSGGEQPAPVGTVIPKSEGDPPRRRRIVVASGVAPITGPWQIEVYRTNGQRDTDGRVMWRRGWCVDMTLLDPPDDIGMAGQRSGMCGLPRSLGYRRTPGFSRLQGAYRSKPPQSSDEVLVWGRVPDRAEKVVISAPGGLRIEGHPTDGPDSFPGRFYAIPVPLNRPGARINWFDAAGRAGSRGIGLMPPITR